HSFCVSDRSTFFGLCAKSGQARRQRHWLLGFRKFGRWQMVGAAQRGCAGGLPSVAIIQPRDRAFRGGLSAISGGGGADTWLNRCLRTLRQGGRHRKRV